jgi:hypothetical protein
MEKQCMETMYGNNVWKQCMETMYGNNVWKQCMETMYGNNVWKQCMETMHGSNLYGSNVRKTKTKKSFDKDTWFYLFPTLC